MLCQRPSITSFFLLIDRRERKVKVERKGKVSAIQVFMGISCSRYVYLFWNKSSSSCSKQEQQSSNSMSTSSSSAPSQRSFGESTGSSSNTTQSSYVTTAGSITSADGGRILVSPNVKIFTFKELKKATKGFDQEHALGQGGFGMVYKAWLDPKTLKPASMKHGMPVAVKKLKSESMQGLQEWKSEVNFLGSLSHPNLVKLLGYCWEGTELLLVYEFMSKGSLENHLFKKGPNNHNQLLSFDLRVKIAIDTARGLAFLHASEKKIIYRDFKASNILLDSSYDAKISDFGLAKIGPCGGETHVSTRVMGTCGYAAPEYVSTGHLYVKSDVYGYGVVLLELLSGRRALVPSRRPQNLVEWARPILSERRNLSSFMDPRLEGSYSSSKAARAAYLALQCVQNDLRDRPSMNDVLETLKQIQFSDHDDKVRYRIHASLNNGRRILRHSSATNRKNNSVVQEAF